jgi:hypothetical protein
MASIAAARSVRNRRFASQRGVMPSDPTGASARIEAGSGTSRPERPLKGRRCAPSLELR